MRINRRVFTASLLTTAATTVLSPKFSFAATENSSGISRASAHSLIGPLEYAEDFKHFDYVNPNAPKGGEVNLAASGSFDSFNGFIPKGSSLLTHLFINDSLMAPTYDRSSEQYGLLAKWMEWPSDHSWVRYKLRDGAYFHDGEPIKASDVVWSLKTLVEKGKPQYPYYYKNVIDAVDEGDGIIKFSFDEKDNKELPHIVGQLEVLPEHWWKDHDFTKSSTETIPLGSGPYKIGNFEAGRWLEFERVENYWAQDLPIRKGQYNFDIIRYRFYKDF